LYTIPLRKGGPALAGWPCTGLAVPPARVPGSPQRACGRVAAPRALLCGCVARAEGTLLRLPSFPDAPHTRHPI